jgi:hypothetical protein
MMEVLVWRLLSTAASAVALGEERVDFLFRIFIEYPVALMCLMDKDE